MMDLLLSWYQRKIGAYDLQFWERAVELREQQDVGIKLSEKQTSSVKSDLIDIDLVRGSTFSKNKPQYSWFVVSCQAVMRVALLPFFFKWWIQQTSSAITTLFICLYALNVGIISLYINGAEHEVKSISFIEVMTPSVIMLLVGGIHCHVVSTNFRLNGRADSMSTKKKRTLSSALLEPVVNSSQQSVLCLLASSLYNRSLSKVSIVKSLEMSPSACSMTDNIQVQPAILGDSGKSSLPGNKIMKELANELLSPVKPPALSTTESNSSQCEYKIDSTHTDGNGTFHKQQLRCNSRYEDLNSGSSGSISSSEDVESEALNLPEVLGKDLTTAPQNMQTKHFSSTIFLPCSSHGSGRISVRVWESNQCKKVQASLLDIGSIIKRKVQCAYMPHDMFLTGIVLSVMLSAVPTLYRVILNLNMNASESYCGMLWNLFINKPTFALGVNPNLKTAIIGNVIAFERFWFIFAFFLMLSAAHKTFHQRLLFAKYFSHLTSSRKAKKSDVPHFRLNKVENVRLWLSLRSYLRKCGPQRSVDVIVSSAFLLSLVLTCFISLQLLHDSEVYFSSLLCWEMTMWLLATALFLSSFMTLGVQVNKKYSNTSVLLTEQMNLYLQMEKKPGKKEELLRVNSVLALAGKLIKEMETPFNIYGLAMNPFLYNISRVVVLSAFSGVLSEMLGFKLKIWKIKP